MTSEQRIGWIALRARTIERHARNRCLRSEVLRRRGQCRRRTIDRRWGACLAVQRPARDVRDGAAARRAHRCILRGRLLLVRIRFRRAAADGTRLAVVRAPVPGRRRDRRHQDQREQDQNDAAHVPSLYASRRGGQRCAPALTPCGRPSRVRPASNTSAADTATSHRSDANRR